MPVNPPPPPPLVLINAVGLTSRWLTHAPALQAIAAAGWLRTLREDLPAVTCTAQASILTGQTPSGHGIVANGWLYRDTREVRFWQQSNTLLEAEPIYAAARHRAAAQGRPFRCAKLFWWFNQGADVDVSVTPKPFYGADGSKVFAVDGQPRALVERIARRLGPFPFFAFWGPRSGAASTAWIARCAAEVIDDPEIGPPDLTLVYLPHLDYDPQRHGPSGVDMGRLGRELDTACQPLLEAARRAGARVWVVSEYGHCDVTRPVLLNQVLREQGLLSVRPGPFGEILDTFASRALAVCDHQLAHVYVRDPADLPRVRDVLASVPGVASLHAGEARAGLGLDHPRSGEIVALAEPDAWFAYPFWLDDANAPDFARTVDIHRKPGFDPCELFLDPALRWPTLRVMRRLLQKRLGFRTLFDVVPLDPALVRGSHGLRAPNPDDRPVLIGDGPPPPANLGLPDVHGLLWQALGLD